MKKKDTTTKNQGVGRKTKKSRIQRVVEIIREGSFSKCLLPSTNYEAYMFLNHVQCTGYINTILVLVVCFFKFFSPFSYFQMTKLLDKSLTRAAMPFAVSSSQSSSYLPCKIFCF